jgi:hypothetical protein
MSPAASTRRARVFADALLEFISCLQFRFVVIPATQYKRRNRLDTSSGAKTQSLSMGHEAASNDPASGTPYRRAG